MSMNEYSPIQQFRIWSPEEKKYHYSGGTPSMLSSFFSQTATLHTVHKMPYQRDTGLHDNNGNEIYEGDLFGELGGDRDRPLEYEIHGQVKWDDDFSMFIMELHNGGWMQLFDYFQSKTSRKEVIGNIYENTELLAS